jgi:hypothetical protein
MKESFNLKSGLYWLSGAVALGIVFVGIFALVAPAAGSVGFGIPASDDALVWVRLAGVRDIALGLMLFAVTMRRESRIMGILILLSAMIPVADAISVCIRSGMSWHVFMHGGSAVFLLILGTLLLRNASGSNSSR